MTSITKKCKHCIEDIPKAASVCSYCRKELNEKWYQRFSLTTFFSMLPLVLGFLYLNNSFSPEFSNYDDEFEVVQENVISINDIDKRIVFRIKNNSSVRWEDLKYQIITSHNNKIIDVDNGSKSNWTVQPHSSSYLTAETYAKEPNTTWTLVITGLSYNKYL